MFFRCASISWFQVVSNWVSQWVSDWYFFTASASTGPSDLFLLNLGTAIKIKITKKILLSFTIIVSLIVHCMLPIIQGESEVFTTLQCTVVTWETTVLLIIVSALHLYLCFSYLYLWVGVFLGSLRAPPLPTEKLLISGVNSLNTPPAQGIPEDRSLRI